MRAVLYARCSTDDKGQTTENQLIKLREYAQKHKYEVIAEFSEYKSGKDQNRPMFKDVMILAREHKIDVILVTKLDRAMRSVQNLLNTLTDLQKENVAMLFIDQDIDTSSAAGKLMMHMLASFAEFERELISERVKDGMHRAKLGGAKFGRPRVSDAKASRTTLWRRSKKEGGGSLYANDQKPPV